MDDRASRRNLSRDPPRPLARPRVRTPRRSAARDTRIAAGHRAAGMGGRDRLSARRRNACSGMGIAGHPVPLVRHPGAPCNPGDRSDRRHDSDSRTPRPQRRGRSHRHPVHAGGPHSRHPAHPHPLSPCAARRPASADCAIRSLAGSAAQRIPAGGSPGRMARPWTPLPGSSSGSGFRHRPRRRNRLGRHPHYRKSRLRPLALPRRSEDPHPMNSRLRLPIILLTAVHLPILLAGWFAPYDYAAQHREYSYFPPSLSARGPAGCRVEWLHTGRLFTAAPPCGMFLLGTDAFGRDIFSRILYGGRISVCAGAIATLLALAFGGAAGTLAGFYGGWPDRILMRGGELLMALPWLYLLLAVRAFLPLHLAPAYAFILFV